MNQNPRWFKSSKLSHIRRQRAGDDAERKDAIKRVSKARRRFGCRHVHVMIARKGCAVFHGKVRRIYIVEKLQGISLTRIPSR